MGVIWITFQDVYLPSGEFYVGHGGQAEFFQALKRWMQMRTVYKYMETTLCNTS